MWKLVLLLLIQAGVPPQREIIGPYTFREDQGQTTKVILKNGLTVIVREEYAVPLAGITTHVKAGTFNEEDRLAGISHVVEHMLSKGKSKRPVLNAVTSYDSTVYQMVVPAASVLTSLEVQAAALRNPAFDPEELKREIEVVLQEDNAKLDTPSSLAAGKLYETAFKEHRMKRSTISSADGLRALTPDDIRAYYEKYYRPSNTILTIVGAFDREQVLEGVVKLYGDAENATVEADVSPTEPVQEGLRYAWRRGSIQETHLAMGFHAPGVLTDDARALEVFASILSTGRASRFHRILRDERNLITAGSAELHASRELGYFQVDLQTSSPIEAATGALAEIENVKRFGVSSESVARARAAIAQNYLGRLETVGGLGGDLAHYEALGDWKLSATYLADIQKVTPQRVMEVARKYLTFANLGVFEYLPDSVERYLKADEYKVAVLDKVEAAVARRNEEELPVTAQIPQRSTGLVTDAVGTIRRQSLLRGPDIYILEDHRLPLVSFGIFFPGGRLMETAQNAGITELMLRSALRGTKSFDSATLARRLENAGVQIQVVNEPDFFGYTLHGLAGRMDQAVQVLVEVLQEPLFEEPHVAGERTLQISRIRSLRDDNRVFPVSLFMQSLFGDVPYGRPAVGTEEGIAKLTATQVRAWFGSQQRKLLPTIVIVGDTRGTALVAPIADALTNEDLEPRDLQALPQVKPAPQSAPAVEGSRLQTALVYGFPAGIGSASQRYAFDVVAQVVGERASAYPIRTTHIANSRGGALFGYVAFSPDKETEVRAALDAEIAKLRRDGVSPEELQIAVQSAIGSLSESLQTRESRVLEYARSVFSGAGIASVGRYDQSVRAVRVDQLRAVIQQYLDPALLRTGIVRGKAQ